MINIFGEIKTEFENTKASSSGPQMGSKIFNFVTHSLGAVSGHNDTVVYSTYNAVETQITYTWEMRKRNPDVFLRHYF